MNTNQSLTEYRLKDFPDGSTFFTLTMTEKDFVVAYAQTFDFQAACHAARINPNNYRTLLSKPHIKSAIAEVLTTQGVTPQEVVAIVTDIMRADVANFLRVTEVNGEQIVEYNLLDALRLHKTGVIRSIEIDKRGKIKVQLYDKFAAAQLMGKYFGLFPDQLETKDTTDDWKADARRKGYNPDEVLAEMKRIVEADSIVIVDSTATVSQSGSLDHDAEPTQLEE